MSCKVLIIAFFALLCAETALAGNFSGWYYPGDSFDFGGHNFTIKGNYDDKVYLSIDDTGTTIRKEFCKDISGLYICLADLTEGSKYDYSRDVRYNTYKIEVTQYLANLNFTRRVEKRELRLGASTRVTLRLYNTGETEASNIQLTETIPEGFLVTNVEGCTITESGVTLSQEFLGVGQTVSCAYFLKAVSHSIGSSDAKITYYDGSSTKTIDSASPTISVEGSKLLVATIFETDPIEIDKTSVFRYAIRNTDTREYDYEVKITYPPALEFENPYKTVEHGVGVLTWREEIEPDEATNRTFIVKGVQGGDFIVETELIPKQIKTSANISVKAPGPDIEIEMPGSLTSGENSTIKVNIQPSEKFSEIRIEFESDIPGVGLNDFAIPDLKGLTTAYAQAFAAPSVESPKDYSFGFTVFYTWKGVRNTLRLSKNLAVNPVPKQEPKKEKKQEPEQEKPDEKDKSKKESEEQETATQRDTQKMLPKENMTSDNESINETFGITEKEMPPAKGKKIRIVFASLLLVIVAAFAFKKYVYPNIKKKEEYDVAPLLGEKK